MAPLDDNFSKALGFENNGSEVGRRLSDKILSAFNHAYAVGENEIAGKLKNALKANEEKRGDPRDPRAGYDPLGQAEKWIAFVEARNAYKSATANSNEDSPKVIEALEEMKDAYRLWSIS